MSEEEEKPKSVPGKAQDLNARVWKEAKRGIKEGRILWGRIVLQIGSIVALILVIVFGTQIASFLKGVWLSLVNGLSDPTNAAVVGNYLLATLILATIGVVFIPPLIRWLNRPKLRLDSFSYFTHPLTVRLDPAFPDKIIKRNIYLVHANVINDGRGIAADPVLLLGSSQESILPFANVYFSAVQLDKEITLLDANVYETNDDNRLAVAFIRHGLRKVPFIPAKGQGKAFTVGFAFEGGNFFYGASDASAGISKQPLGAKERTYLHFTAYARNISKKQLKNNLKAVFPTWDTVKIDYRTLPVVAGQ